MNSINPARINGAGGITSKRDSQPDKSKTADPQAPTVSKTEKPVASAGRFTHWTRGSIPGGWDGPF
jgi:hypothetical protein